MSIRQYNGIWHIDVRSPSGQRFRRSAGTTNKKQAQEYHDKLKAQLWRQHMLGEQPDRSFDEAALRFLEVCEGQADIDSKIRYVAYWRNIIGGKAISQITADDILGGLPTHRTYKHQGAKPLSNATKNRYMATMRTMLNMCVSWGWVSRAPHLPAFKEPKRRIRWVTQEQAKQLINAIGQEWLQDTCVIGFATGMRENELYSLRWSQVNMQAASAWVGADQAKSGRARSIPLNADAMRILKKREGLGDEFVLTRGGKQVVGGDDRMFGRACEIAGIKNFRFHDVRHTWASWHAQAGTPLLVLQQLGGWETLEMVMKYAHLAPSHLASHAKAVTFWSSGTDTKENKPAVGAGLKVALHHKGGI